MSIPFISTLPHPTAVDVYGRVIDESDCPDEYEFTGEFRLWKAGEPWLWGPKMVNVSDHDATLSNHPRYILRKKSKDVAEEFEIAPGKQPRQMVLNDYWLNSMDHRIHRYAMRFSSPDKYLVLRRK